MATGSGKTRTALICATRCPGLRFLAISVPRRALVEQWAEELAKNTSFTNPVLVYESSARWQEDLFNRLRALRRARVQTTVVAIGTMHSMSGARFLSVIADAEIPDGRLMIVDEVHNVGAPTFRRVLNDSFEWRLGLSATPARYFDEEGTNAIESFFNRTVFVYDMRHALADGHLCPYNYYVYPAHLTDAEYAEWMRLTTRITQLRGSQLSALTHQTGNTIDADDDQVKQLLFRRARLLKKCPAKLDALRTALDDHPMHRGLIYCADNEQLQAVESVLSERQLVHLTYTAATPKEERQSALQALGAGHIPLILAIDCLDEGVDVPTVDEAVILASSTNKRQFIQRRGRILRNATGKDQATLVDVVALPPESAGKEARKMLHGELSRIKEMAELADNRYEVLQSVKKCAEAYGVLLTELLTGEGDG